MTYTKKFKHYEILCDLLRQYRKNKEYTQKEIAEKLGVPQSFVSKYEQGERTLDFVEVQWICEALDTPFSDFVDEYIRIVNES